MKWKRGEPSSSEMRGLPSAFMTPVPVHWRTLPHRFVLPEAQNLHSPQKAW